MALAAEALRVLCASGGCLEQSELRRWLPGRPSAEQLTAALRDPRRFTLVQRPGEAGAAAAAEVAVVVATTPVRLCQEYSAGCPGTCGRLHLCKYHLKGQCRNQAARKECRFAHDFHSDHNLPVLKQYGLEILDSDELCQLLLQNDSSLLPEPVDWEYTRSLGGEITRTVDPNWPERYSILYDIILSNKSGRCWPGGGGTLPGDWLGFGQQIVCLHYNKGDGPHGSCTFKTSCTKLHVCQYFLRGQCRFGSSCKRSHDLLKTDCLEKLLKQGMSPNNIEKLPSLYRNMYDIKNGNSNMYDIEESKSSPCKEKKQRSGGESATTKDDESEQICLYNLYRSSCGFKEKCTRTHFHLPYRWQISDGNTWKDLKNMEEIEKAYCDPNKTRFTYTVTQSGSVMACICFRTMCCGFAKVRRLSTASSVTKPPHFILTTEWIWYWKDEYDMWQEYGKTNDFHAPATVSSDDLEKAYMATGSPKLNFKAGRHEYEINFKTMTQKNLRFTTERKVSRRPKFVSQAEVEKTRARGIKDTEMFKGIPAHWDKSALPELGFKLIELDSSSEEYKKVKVEFKRTMPRTSIRRICRVQNPSLWELYQWQKELMQKSNGGKAADERFLFHGTKKKDIDAICQQNFDWRICGLNGTVYGKGSYFARDASYSDKYCGTDSCKTMFLARVLVGEFTCGCSDYVRPPMKDSQSFYDSCVNDFLNPSIFVIFEKQQIYPEYLIEYWSSATLT